MLIIPEIETVLILVPRTGSGSLLRALTARYPKAMPIYRHMEADGVPAGYDRWRRVGVVRDPIDRLWSLYNFLKDFGLDGKHEPNFAARQRDSVAILNFSDWILYNRLPFTTPYSETSSDLFYPSYCVRHPIPENRKSQFVYLRPDLGTEVWHFEHLTDLAWNLGLPDLGRHNVAPGSSTSTPVLTGAARDHLKRFFAWDFEAASIPSPYLKEA